MEDNGIRVAECICHARKVLIEGVPTTWIEGYYKETTKASSI